VFGFSFGRVGKKEEFTAEARRSRRGAKEEKLVIDDFGFQVAEVIRAE
jgi:hypothetical protein